MYREITDYNDSMFYTNYAFRIEKFHQFDE